MPGCPRALDSGVQRGPRSWGLLNKPASMQQALKQAALPSVSCASKVPSSHADPLDVLFQDQGP